MKTDLLPTESLDSRELLKFVTAFRKGDFSARLPPDRSGTSGKIYDTLNDIIELNDRMCREFDRISRTVGKEGKTSARVSAGSANGSWAACIEAVNGLIGDLVQPSTEVARVIGSVAKGDLSQTMPLEVDGRLLKGEFLRTARVVNTMVEQLSSVTSEVTRVAREVGSEGKLGGQADVKRVGGAWKDLTDSVNSMAGNLTAQVRNIAEVTTAVAKGDLSKKITVSVRGEILELKDTINTMVDQLNSFASEVTRVAREVGTEGKLGGQAIVKGVAGTWKDLTESVNSMAGNLTAQVRNIAEVTTAVARGDLSKKITVDVLGEIRELKNTINTMVDQLGSFASEVTRVAREVGTEGKLGGQARVPDVGGTWKDLTESVNSMAGNLTAQVRNIAEVTTAVARGDLSKKITVDVQGEILELKNTINTMVDQLGSFASEVTRVAREVGTEGKLGGQAQVKGAAGTWKDLTDSVNSMAGNLTDQVRNIAQVTTAVARGDLSLKITVDVRGEMLRMKNTINTMVDQLNGFASEVTRVAREVGTEGKLGGQAQVKGVAGTWKDLTDSVNSMAGNLTNQVRNIAEVTTAVARGDLSRKITVDVRGEILELKNTINTMVDQLSSFASEVTRVAREVGTEGKLGGQAVVSGVAGTWKDLTESVNSMASNLTNQVRNIAGVTTAVARGDLSTKITVDVRGEILELKNTINTMVDQLNSFASEVTRVAREVGTEGKLGGQAVVTGVAGTWKDLTESVNSMAANLTTQVRGIAKVVTAVANGDLKRKLILETKGEIAELAETINGMIDTLAVFTEQVTSVAREVGIEGKLGGQANVPGAAGLWCDLTNNVNQLAANLTTQVRAIAEVATAVTKGDLTRSITVQAQGEVAALKDTINEMIGNLKETTRKNREQDWLKTNVARFTRMLQGQRDLMAFSSTVLTEMAPLVEAQHGVFYISPDANGQDVQFKLLASYAYRERKNLSNRFRLGEGLVGQCALEKQRILLTEVPGDYIKINSALGEATPLNIVVFPVLFEGDVKAVVELASFHSFSAVHLAFLEQLAESMGIVLNTIEATMRTEELLTQSQALAEELQSRQKELTEGNRRLEEQARTLQASEELLRHQQEELQHTNSELQEKARLLADQKAEVERKNHEVERAKEALEEKAEQLALTSKYKSEFLANMSHELRTPLNSLLILAQMLAENLENRLTEKQVKAAQTIHQSGVELLSLINDILDLSKIESGTILLDLEQVFVADLKDYVIRTFSHVAEEKGLAFETELGPGLPKTIYTDPRRLQQVLKNLLSNAIKFTDEGGVRLKIDRASGGWREDIESLKEAEIVVAFSIVDTGVGIAEDQQQVIFEAFRQVDGTSSRRYSGTGLGLSICRELAALLGGDIQLESKPGEGSTFSLYLPQNYAGAPAGLKRLSSPRRGPETHRETSQRERAGAAHVRLASRVAVEVEDDRDNITPGERVLLIIEDDPPFARILVDFARQAGFKTVVSLWGDRGLALARELKPDAITLDIRLPDMAGWTILDRMRHDPETRQIPIHVISVDEDRRRGLSLGASSYLEKSNSKECLMEVFERISKSVERGQRELLIVEPDGQRRGRIQEVLVGEDVHSVFVSSGAEAVEAVKAGSFDCVVLGLGMGDVDPFELVETWQNSPGTRELPMVVYIDNNLTPEQEHAMNRLARHALVRPVFSLDRLLEETAVFLHRLDSAMPEESRRKLANMPRGSVIAGGKILIVDDDIRNLFALTSALERHKLEVLHAESGPEGLEILKRNPDVDAVLMDIMMPEMDGYETIRQIRQMPEFRGLPIVALTAKAMGGDREKCIEAGASDYIIKPVNLDDLIWMLRAWMPRRAERNA